MNKSFVAVLIGSSSDLPTMRATTTVLDRLAIHYEFKITSAHRTPEATQAYVRDAESRGCAVFIAGAGLAAHLAGTVAAYTVRPVIGIPMDAGPLHGIDALLSTVQMPGGIPVACVAIGKTGATNGAYLAAEIMALSDDHLVQKLRDERAAMAAAVSESDVSVKGNKAQSP